MTNVKLKHPDSTAQMTVPEDVVPVYASQGWEPVAGPKPEPEGKPEK